MAFDYAAAREKLLSMGACDRCLGRQFRGLFYGVDNGAVGSIVRKADSLAKAKKAKPGDVLLSKDCPLCAGHFMETRALAEKAAERLANLEFSSFLVGCKVEDALLNREEALWNDIGGENCEPLKKDLVRQIGLAVTELTGKDAEFAKPDVTVIADFTNSQLSFDIHPVFIYGEYRKLVRGIPQTRWPCRDCRGRGCRKCNFTGKMYQESVEELVAAPFLADTGAKGEKFHGSGREDIDATMLGWRPFVLELVSPVVRSLDWAAMAAKVNGTANGKVEVHALRPSSKDELVLLKEAKHDKSYEAFIECAAEPSDEAIAQVIALFTNKELEQRTPDRVAHRRADLVRKRMVYSVELARAGPLRLRAVIKAASGTYIKELISGDDGRTKPSFAELLGPCKCAELNVLEVHAVA